jgi:hypothetical protein
VAAYENMPFGVSISLKTKAPILEEEKGDDLLLC